MNIDSHASHDYSNHDHTSQIIPTKGYSCRLDVHGQQIPTNPYGPIQRPLKPNTRPRGPEYSLQEQNEIQQKESGIQQEYHNEIHASLDEYLKNFAESR